MAHQNWNFRISPISAWIPPFEILPLELAPGQLNFCPYPSRIAKNGGRAVVLGCWVEDCRGLDVGHLHVQVRARQVGLSRVRSTATFSLRF